MQDSYGAGLGQFDLGAIPLYLAGVLLVLILWNVFWKACALWHSARHGDRWWFIAFLFVNTIGILEMVYLFAVLKIKRADVFSSKL